AGKFFPRHKLVLVATSGSLLMVLGFSVLSTLLWRQTVSEREQAVRERQRAEAATDFLKDLFRDVDPDAAGGEGLTARDQPCRAEKRIGVVIDLGRPAQFSQLRMPRYLVPAIGIRIDLDHLLVGIAFGFYFYYLFLRGAFGIEGRWQIQRHEARRQPVGAQRHQRILRRRAEQTGSRFPDREEKSGDRAAEDR
ncbi:MAG: hypothetical protein GY856_17615, partial [bacterium]|nr:hypothetical protein [bacterium]